MKGRRKRHSAEFKGKVALEGLKGLMVYGSVMVYVVYGSDRYLYI